MIPINKLMEFNHRMYQYFNLKYTVQNNHFEVILSVSQLQKG